VFGLRLWLPIWRSYVAGQFFAMGCNPTARYKNTGHPVANLTGSQSRKEKAPADLPPAQQ
jgi:hypothetical protein